MHPDHLVSHFASVLDCLRERAAVEPSERRQRRFARSIQRAELRLKNAQTAAAATAAHPDNI